MIISSKETHEDKKIDTTLRPQHFDDYIGQDSIKQNLGIAIQAAQKRGDTLDHILLYGPAGLGKTTLAFLIAKTLSANIKVTSGPALEKVGDLASILTNLEQGDILFIDEIHRLGKVLEEALYSAMEDYVLDIVVGKGPSARTLRLDVPKFTLIGATTKFGSLSSPFRTRFGNIYGLEFYNQDHMTQIVKRSSSILNINAADEGVFDMVARRSRQTPRVANRLVKRVRDFAEVHNEGILDAGAAKKAFSLLGIDDLGLEHNDIKLLQTITELFNGGPVGLSTLATAASEETVTIEEIHEPFLMRLGLIQRTSQGRVATAFCYEYLHKHYPKRL